jgi:hypothetical protein
VLSGKFPSEKSQCNHSLFVCLFALVSFNKYTNLCSLDLKQTEEQGKMHVSRRRKKETVMPADTSLGDILENTP